MGVVYRALDTSLDRSVALKVLRKDRLGAEEMAELETEATLTASINHPHVVKVFTTGTDHGRFYIAMELVSKGTLDDLINIQGRVAETQVLDIAIQVADGLRAAYHAGLIHRDVKPGNILFSDAHTAKIVDFGLAVLERAAAEEAGAEIWGTPYYLAPEKLDQQPEDLRSDIYSLGATLFHALAGRPPFEAENATKVALKHLKSQAVSLQAFAPWVSGSTAYVINRALQKNPDDRYQDYDELIEHLEYARNELLNQNRQPQAQKRVVMESEEDQKRSGYITIGMIAMCLLLASVGIYVFLHHGSSQQKSVASAAAGADSAHASQYESARKLLIAGKFEAAAESFHALGVDSKTPEPLLQWCLLHEGLSDLAASQASKSREVFGTLKSRPYISSDPAGQKLGDFFQEIAKAGFAENPAVPTDGKGFSHTDYSALGLFTLGLKDWALGEYDNSGTLLRDFVSTTPQGESLWVAEYKSLAGDYVADFTDFRGALVQIKATKAQSALDRLKPQLDDLKKSLRRGHGLADRIDIAVKAQSEELTSHLAALSTTPSSGPIYSGRSVRWTFDEKSGTTVSAFNANDKKGTVEGKATWEPGIHKGALTFDGTTTEVEFGTEASMKGNSPFSISAYIKTPGSTKDQVIIQQRCASDSTTNGFAGEYRISIEPTGIVHMNMYGSNGHSLDVRGGIKVDDGNWHNVVVVRNGGDCSLYIDGELDNTVTVKNAPTLNASIRVSVGFDSRDKKSFFKGSIDDIEIWERALTPGDIAGFKNRKW